MQSLHEGQVSKQTSELSTWLCLRCKQTRFHGDGGDSVVKYKDDECRTIIHQCNITHGQGEEQGANMIRNADCKYIFGCQHRSADDIHQTIWSTDLKIECMGV